MNHRWSANRDVDGFFPIPDRGPVRNALNGDGRREFEGEGNEQNWQRIFHLVEHLPGPLESNMVQIEKRMNLGPSVA